RASSATAMKATSTARRCRRPIKAISWLICSLSDPTEKIMTDALTIGWTRAQTETARTTYRRLLGFNLILQTVVALIAIIVRVWLGRSLPGPPSPGWVRLWGAMLLITAGLYLPGCIEPLQVRWPNVVGIVARFLLALAYIHLGQGFWWFAAYELIFAVALAWGYSRLLRAELMSHP